MVEGRKTAREPPLPAADGGTLPRKRERVWGGTNRQSAGVGSPACRGEWGRDAATRHRRAEIPAGTEFACLNAAASSACLEVTKQMDRLEMIVQGLILPGAGALLVGFLAALAKQYIERIKDERLRALLLALVKAAEQIYGPGQGEAKRDYVLQQARLRGLSAVKRADLEAAVWQMKRESVG